MTNFYWRDWHHINGQYARVSYINKTELPGIQKCFSFFFFYLWFFAIRGNLFAPPPPKKKKYVRFMDTILVNFSSFFTKSFTTNSKDPRGTKSGPYVLAPRVKSTGVNGGSCTRSKGDTCVLTSVL